VGEKKSDKKLKDSLKGIVGEEMVDDALDIVDKTLEWYGGFLSSKEFEKLSKKEKDLSEEIIVDFIGLTFYNLKITPEQWGPKTLEKYCNETLPTEKPDQSEDYFKSVTPILFKFFIYLDKNKLLEQAKVLADKIENMNPDFIEAFETIDSEDELDSSEIIDEVYEWLLEFEKSEHYQKLSEVEQTDAEEIILNFTDFMYGYFQAVPEEWDEDILEDCVLNILPAKLPVSEKVFKAFYPVLANFFSFLDDVKILSNGAALSARLKKVEKEMLKKASDQSDWDIDKIIVLKAKEAGIDIHDQKAMDKFINKNAKKIMKEFDREEDSH
jgi:hypothetical protein